MPADCRFALVRQQAYPDLENLRGETNAQQDTTWCRSAFVAKVFYLLMDLDEMIGTDYEAGLQALKVLSEQ